MFDTKRLHHSYLLPGKGEEILPNLLKFIENEMDFKIQGNPDFRQDNFDVYGIDESRSLVEWQSMKPFGEGKKIAIISFRSITREAQNSLLKVFEEPAERTHFFVITPFTEEILPTLRSRFLILDNVSENNKQKRSNKEVVEFLSKTPAERIKFVSKIIENKDKISANNLIESITYFFHEKLQKVPNTEKKEISNALKEIVRVGSYTNDRSSSMKLVLEHLSLVLPPLR